MQVPLQVTFRDFPSTAAISEYVEKKASKLETLYGKLMSCHVVIEDPHRHHHHGRTYRVRIHLTVPGHELVAGGSLSPNMNHQNAYAAIDDAFSDAQRVLRDCKTRSLENSKRGRSVSTWQ